MRILRSVGPLLLALGVGAPLGAQSPQFLLSGGAGLVRLGSTTVTDQLSGVLVGGRALASISRLEVELSYAEATLNPERGTPASRDLVEGRFMVGVRPAPWLSLRVGPHARGYVTGGITERWLLWEARARADAFVVRPAIRGYLEMGGALAGSIRNGAGSFGNSRLGEAGMVIRFPKSPVWLLMSYGVERSRFASIAGLDALESLSFSLGIGSEKTRS